MDRLVEKSLTIISNAIEIYPRIAVASSFGKDSMVLIDLARRIDKNIQVFSVMTRYKPELTLMFKGIVHHSWDLNLKTFWNHEDVPDDLHTTDPDKCCELLKVKPMREAIQ